MSSSRFDQFLSNQLHILGALLMREVIIRYGRNNIGFLWLTLEPMLFTLGVTSLWFFLKANHGSSLPITAFALTGYSSVLLWRNTANKTATAIKANVGLLYHQQIKIIHLFLARIFLEIGGATISFSLLYILFITFGWINFPPNILKIVLGWFLISWFGLGLALVIGAISERYEVIDRIWHTITYLLFPLSGAAFMVDWLPKQFQEIVLWLPMVNGVELIRDGAFGALVHTHYSITYMIFFCSVLMLIGLVMVKEASMHVGME